MTPGRLKLGFACAIASLLAAPAHADGGTESFTLKNGLEVVVIQNHRLPAISHMMWYRIGAGDDPPGKSGLAHYHEHMMFEGTLNHKPGEYAAIINQHGGQQNAFTGYDATSYFVNIAKKELPLIMQLEAERMRGIQSTDAGAAKEKQVIIEERRLRIENSPEALLAEQMNAALFRNHPYHWPVIGWMHEMEGLTKDDVMRFHQTYYHPNNAILVVSGDITAAELKPLAEKYYGPLPAAPIPPRRWNAEPPQNSERHLALHHPNMRQPQWSRIYAAPSLVYGRKEESLPLLLLAQIMGGGKTSRLYESLVVTRKLASNIDTGYDGFTLGPSEFEISLTPEDGVDLNLLEQAVNEEVASLQKDGVSETDLARAKILLKSESIYARDSLTAMARIMGFLRILGLDKDYFTRWPDLIQAVTLDQVNAALRDVLKPNQSVTGLLLPPEAKGAK